MPPLHDDEIEVDDELVATLVRSQMPEFASRALQRLAGSSGTDNVIYRCGDDLAIRFPRVDWAVGQIRLEHTWLPRLAPHLPVALPQPIAVGGPGEGYPYPWLVYRWLTGVDATAADDADWNTLASDLGACVSAVHRIDTVGAPPSAGRGAPLEPEDEAVCAAIEQLDGEIDVRRARAVWSAGLDAGPWSADPVWVHGDLLPGNVLVAGGRLVGLIDWAASGTGDPACDAMIAWAMPPAARARFRELSGIDEPTWLRGRAWVVQQAVAFIPYYRTTLPAAVAAARARLDAVLVG